MIFFESEDFYCDYLPYLADINKPQFLIVGEYDMICGKFEQEWFAGHSPKDKIQIQQDRCDKAEKYDKEYYRKRVQLPIIECGAKGCAFIAGRSLIEI